MAECKGRVGKGVITFQCDLTADHRGPCRAVENPRSVEQRERWERDQRHEASGLGEFQAPAQTTAERYTEGATPPPGQEEVGDGADAQVIPSEPEVPEADAKGAVPIDSVLREGDELRLFNPNDPTAPSLDEADDKGWSFYRVLVHDRVMWAYIQRAVPEKDPHEQKVEIVQQAFSSEFGDATGSGDPAQWRSAAEVAVRALEGMESRGQ